MSNYENNIRVPDNFLFQFFMQRLGVAAEDFAIMLNKKEYEYYVWKEKTLSALEDNDFSLLKHLVDDKISQDVRCNYNIQKQHLYYVKAVIKAKSENDYQEAVKLLKMAAEQTIPDIYNISNNNILLSSSELKILILYFYYGMETGILEIEEAQHFFEEIEKFITSGLLEKNEMVKIYPKLVCIWLNGKGNITPVKDQIFICEKVINLLSETRTLYDVLEILKIYINLLEILKLSKIKYYQKYYQSFISIYEIAGIENIFRPEFFGGRKAKLYMFHEFLQTKRKIKKLSQMEVCEGVCEPESYSRLESGKRTPSVNNFFALTKKLDMGWAYYRGELVTDDVDIYELRRRHRTAVIEEDWENSLKVLDIMESKLDMSEVINYQYIKSKQNVAQYRLGYISSEEALSKNNYLLDLTYKNEAHEEKYCFSQIELEIIAYNAKFLRFQGKFDEGIQLLEKTFNIVNKSRIHIEYQWNGVDFILRVLSDLYFSLKDYRKSLSLCEYVYKINIKMLDGGNLPQIMDAMADNLEHLGEKYYFQYKRLYQLTYYMADFYGLCKTKDFIGQYYKDNIDKEIEWY